MIFQSICGMLRGKNITTSQLTALALLGTYRDTTETVLTLLLCRQSRYQTKDKASSLVGRSACLKYL